MNKYTFEMVDATKLDLDEYYRFSNKPVFSTMPWLKFVEEDNHAVPVFVRITDSRGLVGYFTAMLVKKMGVRILASPFNGWSTCYMGIDSDYIEEKCNIIEDIIPFLYKRTKCQFIQIIDRDVTLEDARAHGFNAEKVSTLELNIDLDDAELFKQMKTDCRNFIRQFERRGARIEVAKPDDSFAVDYYEQLKDVFAKQGLVPTYSLEKVKTLLHSLAESGEILCLRVISPDDRCIATSIFPGYGEKFFFWGGASLRPDQHFRPNEYMIWTAIQYWRDRGCKTFDMVGVRDYKRKFGSYEVEYASMVFTRYKILITGKKLMKAAYYKITKVKGFILNKK